jgi:hypothetical protein
MLINKWYTKFEEEKVEITSFDHHFFLGFFWHVHLAHKIDAKKIPCKTESSVRSRDQTTSNNHCVVL